MYQTFYAKTTGVEVTTNAKKVWLRFFTFGEGNGKKEKKFALTANEAFHLSLAVLQLVKTDKKNFKLIHKFNDKTTTLTLEKWVKDEKSGFGIVIQGGEDKINVPLNQVDFLFFGKVMEVSAIDAVKEKPKARKKAEPEAEGEKTIPEEVPVDVI